MKQFPERVQTGGLTGQGFTNLLGSPRLDRLTLVLREAAQNAWDARPRSSAKANAVRFSVRVRTLTAPQEKEFRRIFDQAGTKEPKEGNALARCLAARGSVRVLEICDYGTVGLTGSTRPDQPLGGDPSRFIDFFFDIGKAHVESGDGGTYGFGRSSLYLAGNASTIIVDTLPKEVRGHERRMMACRIGSSFEVPSGPAKGRYSGRHYWGESAGGITAQPVIGSQAAATARRLGMPDRDSTETGTSILIPWPGEEFCDGQAVADALLHNLWPKMVASSAAPAMQFEVFIDEKRVEVPAPWKTEQYRLFVDALQLARTRNEKKGALMVETLRPIRRTGHLALAVGIVDPMVLPVTAPPSVDEDDQVAGPVVNQVALMRPSELVVRYLPISGTELPDRKWAGVFICSDEEEIRAAFARSEPPAHDDWIADRLKTKQERYLVRKSVESIIPAMVRDRLGVGTIAVEASETDGPSLALASARFSQLLLAGAGQLPGHGTERPEGSGRRNGGSGEGRGRAFRIATPEPAGLRFDGERRVILFRTKVSGPKGATATFDAVPEVHSETHLESLPEGLELPVICGWEGGVGSGSTCTVTIKEGGTEVLIHVRLLGNYAVTLECVMKEGRS